MRCSKPECTTDLAMTGKTTSWFSRDQICPDCFQKEEELRRELRSSGVDDEILEQCASPPPEYQGEQQESIVVLRECPKLVKKFLVHYSRWAEEQRNLLERQGIPAFEKNIRADGTFGLMVELVEDGTIFVYQHSGAEDKIFSASSAVPSWSLYKTKKNLEFDKR